ncbi:hypothetical protein N7532_006180 [Penicillium argentinense]|uniref:Ankyrin repeat protein n=1 Tax=Penicillium argentinense TaxID=1131581 RepID=A0A9W9KAI1_9EURO|nr:uncharacterized protein N7532_006180 [Penicillium argentinense]KAJ5099179.1 hypothetical protein N7532_006180 [Penicillium argentinense]
MRRRQTHYEDFTTSIDFGGPIPQIIKAAQEGSCDDVERLIEQGCDIEECHTRSHRNALLVAAHWGNADIVELLIQRRAKLNVIDTGGWPAFYLSASRGHRDHAASKRGDSEIAQLLISHNADLEANDRNMMTALHHACERGHSETISILLDNRAATEAPVETSRYGSPARPTQAEPKPIIVLFLSSNKIPESSFAEIAQLPRTLGFASSVSDENEGKGAAASQAVFEISSLRSDITPIPSSRDASSILDAKPNPLCRYQLNSKHRILKPNTHNKDPNRQSQDTHHPSTFAIEAGSSMIHELTTTLDEGLGRNYPTRPEAESTHIARPGNNNRQPTITTPRNETARAHAAARARSYGRHLTR